MRGRSLLWAGPGVLRIGARATGETAPLAVDPGMAAEPSEDGIAVRDPSPQTAGAPLPSRPGVKPVRG